MQTIPARITGIKTSDDLDAMRAEVAAGAVADRFKTAVETYSHRNDAMQIDPAGVNHRQDSLALFHALGGLEDYLRRGGDPAVAVIVQSALNFAENC